MINGLKYPLRWLAIKLLENDADIRQTIGEMSAGTPVLAAVDAIRNKTMVMIAEDLEITIVEKRYHMSACRRGLSGF
jgi:ferrous iron transport protein B